MHFIMYGAYFQNDDQRIIFILSYISNEGRTGQWKRNYFTSHVVNDQVVLPTFQQFVTDFRAAFAPIEDQTKAIMKLSNLQRGKTDIDTFNIEFNNLVGRANLDRTNSAPLLITLYRNALKTETVRHIIGLKPFPVTIDQWQIEASHYENIVGTIMGDRNNQHSNKKKPQWKGNGGNRTYHNAASSSAPPKDPDAMDVDRMTADE